MSHGDIMGFAGSMRLVLNMIFPVGLCVTLYEYIWDSLSCVKGTTN